MTELIKIKDVSARYDVTARTLRYYEDMGLIQSHRNEDYAYRMYDEAAIKRIEQILILRKLNISIKDIQRIFRAEGSDVVLEVLGNKVSDIDSEAALLHELKQIVLEFIEQIQKVDFARDADVKQLYEKASQLKQQIAGAGYEGNPSPASRLAAVSQNLKKRPEVRVVEVPRCKMVVSGYSMNFDDFLSPGGFDEWFTRYSKGYKWLNLMPRDFLYFEPDGRAQWMYAVEDSFQDEEAEGFEVIEFEGGLYANAISVDGDDDIGGRVYQGIKAWVKESGFEMDEREGHRTLCHMIVGERMNRGLGYEQLDIFVPIKLIGE